MRALVTGRPRGFAIGAALLVAAVGAGYAGFSGMHKDVTLNIDGRVRHVSSMSGTVSGLLHDEGVTRRRLDFAAPVSSFAGLQHGLAATLRCRCSPT